jgi:hypothetical protein
MISSTIAATKTTIAKGSREKMSMSFMVSLYFIGRTLFFRLEES